jgi:hypothetical protein
VVTADSCFALRLRDAPRAFRTDILAEKHSCREQKRITSTSSLLAPDNNGSGHDEVQGSYATLLAHFPGLTPRRDLDAIVFRPIPRRTSHLSPK